MSRRPHVALLAGPDGLSIVRRIVTDAPPFLDAEGVLAVEVGAGQAVVVSDLMTKAGYREMRVAKDYARIDRVVSGVRPRA